MAEDEKKKKPLYGGSYDEQIRDTYSQMQSRPAFSYDLDGDALYQQYRDRYTQNAKLAMKDTMGQAASLTGGYGSSYAQGVGQQRYDETMRGLTDMIPSLEQSAYQRWRDQGSDLQQRYSMLMNMGAAEQGTAQNAYSNLYALIGSTGYQPSPEELAAAGMTQEAADALRNEYLRQTGQLPAAGGTGGGGGGNPNYTPPTGKMTLDDVLKRATSEQYSSSGARQDLFRAVQEEIKKGNTSFTMQDLYKLYNDHHW